MANALLTNTITTAGETFVRKHAVVQALDVRDALGKALYDRLFSWIVNRINRQLHSPSESMGRSIAVLDIFGFEHFRHNSLEQLCINIANEQLQFFFNEYIFTWELNEYEKEGIDAQAITFASNQPVLDLLLGKPLGVLTLLDEESKFTRATDDSLLLKLHQHLSSAPAFHKPSSAKASAFGIVHYAGEVVYNVRGFLEKNRDTLSPNLATELQISSCRLVRELFSASVTPTGSISGRPAAAARGRDRLGVPSTTPPARSPSPGADGMRRSIRGKSVRRSVRKTGFARLASRVFSRKRTKDELAAAHQPIVRPRQRNAPTRISKRTAPTISSVFRASLAELMDRIMLASPFFVRCIKPNRNHSPGLFLRDVVLPQLQYTGVLETARIRGSGYAIRVPFAEFVRTFRIIAFEYSAVVPDSKDSCTTILKLVDQ